MQQYLPRLSRLSPDGFTLHDAQHVIARQYGFDNWPALRQAVKLMELLEKLAALVPPPRFHLLRYHGVLAPRARDRGRIVPTKPVAEPAADRESSAAASGHRLRWAALMARVFSSDLSACAAVAGA